MVGLLWLAEVVLFFPACHFPKDQDDFYARVDGMNPGGVGVGVGGGGGITSYYILLPYVLVLKTKFCFLDSSQKWIG